MNRSTRLFLLAVSVLLCAAAAPGQNNCGVPLGVATTPLPTWSGTLPGSADMSTALSTNYLYVLTQWGFARAPLGTGENPNPYGYIVMGNEGGSGSPGVIPINCDCHQGSNVMDVAEGPGGESRMISDWQPYGQGGGDPSDPHFSGYAAQVAKTTGGGNPAFGQQINLPGSVAPSARVAAIYIDSSGKYFGYFPVFNAGVYMADVTSPSGNPSPLQAIQPSLAIGWQSGSISGTGTRLRAAHVVTSTYDKYLLVGATMADDMVHVAEIGPSSGLPAEVASIVASAQSAHLVIAVVND
jgi:hypothetical protein